MGKVRGVALVSNEKGERCRTLEWEFQDTLRGANEIADLWHSVFGRVVWRPYVVSHYFFFVRCYVFSVVLSDKFPTPSKLHCNFLYFNEKFTVIKTFHGLSSLQWNSLFESFMDPNRAN